MTQAAQKIAPQPVSPTSTQTRTLKKGEILFGEGEGSRSMYVIKNGMFRIFKRKGNSDIEIDTIRSGQVLGELAFLDGNPRSASAEALVDSTVVEISGPAFQEVLNKMPDWLKLLLKTVVGRLRTASTRIRQLESASTTYAVNEKDGRRAAIPIYLSPSDALKICSAILLVATKGEPTTQGNEIRASLLQRYANNIFGVPMAKVTSVLDLLTQVGVLATDEETKTQFSLADPEFLEQYIAYQNDENLTEPAKRHDLSMKGFLVMSLMAKNLDRYPVDPASETAEVNVAEIATLETPVETGKAPFKLEDVAEISKLGYGSTLNVKSATEACITVKPKSFKLAFKLQRVVMAIYVLNEQKKKNSLGIK